MQLAIRHGPMNAPFQNVVSVQKPAVAPLIGCLGASDLFASIEPKELATLAEHAWRRTFKLGERLFETGQKADAFTVITRGLVKVVCTGADSNDCILAVFGAHQSVGTAAAMRASQYPASAYAVSNTVDVVRIDARPVLSAMQRSVGVAKALNRALLAHDQALRSKIEIMSAGSVPQRLAKLFLVLADRFGDEMDGNRLVVFIALSRMDLAALVGARVETVIRVVSAWQKAGVLGTTPDGFELLLPDTLQALTRAPFRCGPKSQ